MARAYAILGMFIVNFTFCFGAFQENTFFGKSLTLFVGNSTSIFIICAGIGVTHFSDSFCKSKYKNQNAKSILLKRSWFLFAIGILLYAWWPGDILHFYGGYLHFAAFLLFVPKKHYLWIALICVIVYNILQYFIPITTGWNLQTTKYSDFWTIKGFIRNTFYNGWNSIFPWFAYFTIGMFLGKLDWKSHQTKKGIFVVGLVILCLFKGLRLIIRADIENPVRNPYYVKYWFYLMEDYFPSNIPFMMITLGFAFMVISVCMFIGDRFSKSKIINWLSKTGQMTLSLYVFHITAGMLLLSQFSGIPYTGLLPTQKPLTAAIILTFAVIFFIFCVILCNLWSRKFRKGPLETVMRKISD